ncbi:hypothetical protein Tco_0960961 [Tanacetum coccineum]
MSRDWTPALEVVTVWSTSLALTFSLWFPMLSSLLYLGESGVFFLSGSGTQLRIGRDSCGYGLLLVARCSRGAVLCGSQLALGRFRTLPVAGSEPVACYLVWT